MKLYVDDIREIPSGWDYARSYDEAIFKLTFIKYEEISLDHDIASFNESGREMTGYDIALWLASRKNIGDYIPPMIYCHSANPVGRKNIESVIIRYLS